MEEQVPQVPGVRKCLRCGKDFKSKGSANRICGSCSAKNSSARGSDGFSAVFDGYGFFRGFERTSNEV